jgi:membrane protein DedA with SNARE-associated domain
MKSPPYEHRGLLVSNRREWTQMFEHVLQVAEPWLEQYGYVAVFGAMFLEGIGIPAPGLTFLIASVMLANQGAMHIALVVGLAVVGILTGCQLAYLIGKIGGRRLLLRIGLVNRPHLLRLHELFGRWGAPLLVAAPFLDGTRQTSSLVAGTAELNWSRFTLYNFTGVVLWIGIWSTATDVLGHQLGPVVSLVHRSAPWLLGAVATTLLVLLVSRLSGNITNVSPQSLSATEKASSQGPVNQESRSLNQQTRETIIMGAVSYVILAVLISIPFWFSS